MKKQYYLVAGGIHTRGMIEANESIEVLLEIFLNWIEVTGVKPKNIWFADIVEMGTGYPVLKLSVKDKAVITEPYPEELRHKPLRRKLKLWQSVLSFFMVTWSMLGALINNTALKLGLIYYEHDEDDTDEKL